MTDMHTIWNAALVRSTLYTPRLLGGLAIAIGAWVAGMAAERLATRIARDRAEGTRQVIVLVGTVARHGVVIIGLITALGTLGVNVSALVAGLGLTGFALGFACRDALSNLLAGIMVLLYRPFSYDDRIRVGDFEGVVTEINLRYTTLAGDDRRILIPNASLLSNTVQVLSPVDARSPAP